jgi:pSer/pThr/pTyr-binding forkhead associated (FHA) protein/preprotein translocase subunit Sec61beta
MASISIHAGGGVEKYTLQAESVTLGRGAESDIRLNDIKASRIHVEIVRTPEGYVCSDLDSGNGTRINGEPIKEQMLRNGAKIQIGSTVIVFSGPPAAAAPAPAPAPKPATARVSVPKPTAQRTTATRPGAKPPTAAARPVAKPATTSAKPVAKPPTTAARPVTKPPTAAAKPVAKPPTTAAKPVAKPPTTAAKPVTATKPGVPVVKSPTESTSGTRRVSPAQPGKEPSKTTGSVKRVTSSTRPVTKNGIKTQKAPKAKTGRFTKSTRKIGKTTRSINRGGMTERFHKEASRKKINPITVLIVGIALIFLGAVAYIFIAPSEVDIEVTRNKLLETEKKAAEMADNFKFDESIVLYTQAIELCKELETKLREVELKAIIKNIESRREQYQKVCEEYAAFKAAVESEPDALRKHWEEGMKIARRLGKSGVPWKSEFDGILDGIGRKLDAQEEARRNLAFPKWRSSITKKYTLDESGEENWTGAFAAAEAYLANKDVSESDKGSAKEWVDRQQSLAFERADSLIRKARRLVEGGDPAAAVELLKKARPRFEGAKCIENLDKYLKEIDK